MTVATASNPWQLKGRRAERRATEAPPAGVCPLAAGHANAKSENKGAALADGKFAIVCQYAVVAQR